MRTLVLAGLSALMLFGATAAHADETATAPPSPRYQTMEEVKAKSDGCISCHTATDSSTMHANPGVMLGCTDCHGGNATVARPPGSNPNIGPVLLPAAGSKNHGFVAARNPDPAYRAAMDRAHVLPRYPEEWNWPISAKPAQTYTLLNRESPEFVRFMNPSDYRIAREACGSCHRETVEAAERSLMATSAMLWGGAAYNNGIVPYKRYVLGESYVRDGTGGQVFSPVEVNDRMKKRGILPNLMPLPRWEVTPPADVFRVFERGGRVINSQFPEIGNPNSTGDLQKLDENGRPDFRQSNRGAGTGLRIAVPLINIHKTRLNDPYMWFLGTNDQPGDYRSSGCAGCHVVYANDKDPAHSAGYAKFGHDGTSISVDPTIPHNESGHPLQHVFTRSVPSSQCMICHMHQPNIFVNTFFGYTMWDYESDAPFMWPEKQKYPTDSEIREVNERNPEAAAVRGKWSSVEFLSKVSELNPQLKNTQFADYHGHGWNFRAVFKSDRKGNLLDAKGNIVSHDDPDKFKKAVHLTSIHLDKGMHCVDCHFSQDNHGNGYIYGEASAAIEVQCVDCHGTADKYPTLRTSGPAAQPGGRDLMTLRNEDGSLRFEWRNGKLIQRSALNPGLEWEISLVKDTVSPDHPRYNAKAARAKLMMTGTSMKWGPGVGKMERAHKDEEMMCITCHTSWTTSCAGCHLPIEANFKTERHHYEGGETRNYATYNPQVARDDMFFLGKNSTPKNNIIAPVRSSSALVLSSTNINRERVYIQQAPVAASGFSSQAFAPHYPHTERTVETKTCEDCHVSERDDNNAIMAQLLLLGTNFVNFVGYNAWVGEDGGVEAVRVTEWEEPQAVIGSYLHRYAYPDWFAEHQGKGRELQDSVYHDASLTRCIQQRGEFMYTAAGDDGLRVFDVASIANKGVSEKILTGPVSPLGQNMHIPSKNATCVALPTNQPVNPARNAKPLMTEENEEQKMHPLYHYAFVTDAEEGLIVTNVDVLTAGDPRDFFLFRAATWNENGVLTGATHITLAGTTGYVTTPRGIVVLDLDSPIKPSVKAIIPINNATSTAVQFRYLFVTDPTGLRVVDISEPSKPEIVEGAVVPLKSARRVYVARTFAYVADGSDGIAIIDVERPRQPHVYQMFNAEGQIKDAYDVIVGSTNASLFAYVADGAYGLKVVQLTSPSTQPGFYGFSPDPKPNMIAWKKTTKPALALSKGLDRDRAVDETGNQIAVFGRIGSRPFTLPEMKKLYMENGKVWSVTNELRKQDFLPGSGKTAPAKMSDAATPAAPVTPVAAQRPGTKLQ